MVDLLKAKLTGGENPYWNFLKWAELEKRYGFESGFYLSCPKSREPEDPKYNLRTDGPLQKMLETLLFSGFEVGLHGSLKSAGEVTTLKEERDCLRQVLKLDDLGVRQHYLRMEVPLTWQIQQEAGFLYDSTLGYPDEIGFRCGLASPFRPYDLLREKRLDILELPLTIMDGVLFEKGHADRGEALSRCLQILKRVETGRGLAVILWHLRSWYERDFPDWRWVYEQILSYLSEREAWVTSPGEIAKWWKQRNESILTE